MRKQGFVRLCYADGHIRLAILRGLLEAGDIDFYVHNDHFGSLRAGPNIPLLNDRSVMVASHHKDRAREVLDHLEYGETSEDQEERGYSFFDKLRMIAEVLLFGRFMPGRSRRR